MTLASEFARVPCVVLYVRRRGVLRIHEALLWSGRARIFDWSDAHGCYLESTRFVGSGSTIDRVDNRVMIPAGFDAVYVAESLTPCTPDGMPANASALGYEPVSLLDWPADCDVLEDEVTYCAKCEDFLPASMKPGPCAHLHWRDVLGYTSALRYGAASVSRRGHRAVRLTRFHDANADFDACVSLEVVKKPR